MKNILICHGLFDSTNRTQFEQLGLDVPDEYEKIPMRIVLDQIVTWIDCDDYNGEKTCIIHMANGKSFWVVASIDVIDKMMIGQ